MMLKRTLAAALAALSVLSLAACGGGQEPEAETPDAPDTEEQINLTYAFWNPDQEPMLRAMADAFEAEHQNIKVDFQITPWDEYWTKLEAGATAGQMPDAFWMHANVIDQYVDAGILAELVPDETFDPANYVETVTNIYKRDGKYYAVPKDYDTIALFYNKELFDKAGIAYPDATWTWDTMLEAAEKMTDAENGVYGLLGPLQNHQGYYNLIHQNGGRVITDDHKSGFDMPETIEAVQFWYDLSHKYGVSPTNAQFEDIGFDTMFSNGKAAMSLMGSWKVVMMEQSDVIKGKYDVAVLPAGKVNATTMLNGLGHAVSASSEHVDAAIEFVKFMGSKEANEFQGSFGAVIPAYLGTEAIFGEKYPQLNTDAFYQMAEYSTQLPATKSKSSWEKAEKDIARRIFAEEISVEEGCRQIAEKVNEILAND